MQIPKKKINTYDMMKLYLILNEIFIYKKNIMYDKYIYFLNFGRFRFFKD